MLEHTFKDYQKKKTFSSFLSGIAGKMGIPLWAFYVNRGQLISSFGIKDKNGAMMEFFPANQAYHFVSTIGFRTFIKVNGKVHEFFKEENSNQSLHVRQDQVSITEDNQELGIEVKVTYFTLPNASVAGLVRKVDIKNTHKKPIDIEVIDGLAQMLPSGIDYGGYKAISNLLQSWMSSVNEENYVFYKLRASTGDSAEVSEVVDGNFYHTSGQTKPFYISDYKLIFEENTSLTAPYGFMTHDLNTLKKMPQTHVNQVPCAMSGFEFKSFMNTSFVSLIGYAKDKNELTEFTNTLDLNYLLAKEKENLDIHESLVSAIETKTSSELLNNYYKQCYLDNVLRGGTPLLFETLSGTVGYHLYSRKHGDLERDYNFFSIEPAFYSQGNGNFRDVLQNRRNDLFFYPEIKDFNIYQFTSLIQPDGYNPLSIEGVKFKYLGKKEDVIEGLSNLLSKEFTPGEVATQLYQLNLEVETHLKDILKQSEVIIKANFGEGYWEDHFTYHYDLLESFLSIYPDELKSLLFDKAIPFFISPVKVLPRSEKYVLTKEGKVRQYGAIKHDHSKESGWLKNDQGLIKINLFGKLLTLVLNKYAHLDPYGIGLSYEGDKPGWNDAMNGVPGLFGSGVSESIELKKMVEFLLMAVNSHPQEKVTLLESTLNFAEKLKTVSSKDAFTSWEKRMACLETYRDDLEQAQVATELTTNDVQSILNQVNEDLKTAIQKAKAIDPVYPTYLTFEATHYEVIKDDQGQPVIGHYGLPLVKVLAFDMKPLPNFLEAPARYLKTLATKEEAKEIYQKVKASGLYDEKLKFYQTSVSLDDYGHEIGRIRAFTPGWLERESNFLHMTYKYLLGLLKSGLYDEFYDEIKTNYTCFMDPNIYGRSPYENSSFLATSSNPDPKKHGQGFVSRLTGSTAEMLSMWRYMFFGKQIFTYQNNELVFELSPKLSKSLFLDGKVEVKLFNKTQVVYHLESDHHTYDPSTYVYKMTLHTKDEVLVIDGSQVKGAWTKDIRNGNVYKINVYLRGGK